MSPSTSTAPALARRGAAALLASAVAFVLAACTGSSTPSATVGPTEAVTTPSAAPSSSSPSPSTSPSAAPVEDLGPLVPSGDPVPVASNLPAPWSIAVLGDGAVLVSLRDSGQIVEIGADGAAVPVTTVPGVSAAGEGGLLGIATLADASGTWLYAMFTGDSDNRVVRMPLGGTAGARTVGEAAPVLTGLPKASNHNGGRIAFGPDGMLYVTAGDASSGSNAQTLDSLGGKILRVAPDGSVPADNPFPGSAVWSLGHRNPQGIAWADDGTLWAAEFGQDTFDEINRIVPGGNYGWPIVEGIAGDPNLIDPVQQWPTDDASPSGVAVVGDTVFMAGLGGERLWSIDFAGAAQPWYQGSQLGRVRDVVRGPGSSLYLLTNNTDGRGTPRAGDDVLYRIDLVPAG